MMPDSNYDFGNETKNSEITLCRWTCLTRMWICDFTNRFAVFFAKLRFVYCKCKTDQNKILITPNIAWFFLNLQTYVILLNESQLKFCLTVNTLHSTVDRSSWKLKNENTSNAEIPHFDFEVCTGEVFSVRQSWNWRIMCTKARDSKSNVRR